MNEKDLFATAVGAVCFFIMLMAFIAGSILALNKPMQQDERTLYAAMRERAAMEVME